MSMFKDYSNEPETDSRDCIRRPKPKLVRRRTSSSALGRSRIKNTKSKMNSKGTVMDGYADDDYDFHASSEDNFDEYGDTISSDEGTSEQWAELSKNVSTPGWLEEDMAEGP